MVYYFTKAVTQFFFPPKTETESIFICKLTPELRDTNRDLSNRYDEVRASGGEEDVEIH